ncbi:MAG: S8 family serine peptidase [Blastocatellales bacterium]
MIKDIQCPNCDNVTEYARICQICGYRLPKKFSPARSAFPGNLSVANASHIDPKLERQLVRSRNRIYRPASGSIKEGETAVILVVEEEGSLPGNIRKILSIPLSGQLDKYYLVTARMPLSDVDKLDDKYLVKAASPARSFATRQAAQPVETARSICEEIGLQMPGRSRSVGKVIVGIIDFGIDFAHSHFLKDGRTRIRAIWNQAGRDNSTYVKYGALYRSGAIDRALNADDPYAELGYGPPADSMYETGAHGTYVADIAAGSGFGGQAMGIAPDAEIVFVDLARFSSGNFAGSTYGDSAHLLEAVDFILHEAEDLPCVINISLGSNDGPHDGTTLVEIGIDRLIEKKKNCAVVIAGGNARKQKLHAKGSVKKKSILDLYWYVPPYDMTSNEIELWYPAGACLSVQILDPDNAPLSEPIGPGKDSNVRLGTGGSMLVINRKCDPVHERFNIQNKKGTIHVFYERRNGYLKNGRWKIRLRNEQDSKIAFDAWIERDERGQSVFVERGKSDFVDPESFYEVSEHDTLNSIAHGEKTLVVGSYNQLSSGRPSSSFSSYRKAGSREANSSAVRPDILAPGENILAAWSGTAVLRYRQTGTSMSAAIVTGVIARMFAEDKDADYKVIKDRLMRPVTGSRSDRKKSSNDPMQAIKRVDPEEAINKK